ncbi:hypothetical protein AAC387_Pa01g1174 [Persea americana]
MKGGQEVLLILRCFFILKELICSIYPGCGVVAREFWEVQSCDASLELPIVINGITIARHVLLRFIRKYGEYVVIFGIHSSQRHFDILQRFGALSDFFIKLVNLCGKNFISRVGS